MDQQQQTILNCLFRLAWADGEFGPEEKSVMDRVMTRMGLSRGEIMQQIEEHTGAPPAEQDLGLALGDHQGRLDAMRMMLMVCFCDDYLSPEEVDFVAELSVRLGIRADELEELRAQAERALSPETQQASGFQATSAAQMAKQAKPDVAPLKLD